MGDQEGTISMAPAPSLRERALAARDIDKERMTIQEWDGIEIELRGLTGAARAEVYNRAYNPRTSKIDIAKLYAELVIQGTFVPGTDNHIFNPDDIGALNQKSAKTMGKIADRVMKLSGLSQEDLEQEKKD